MLKLKAAVVCFFVFGVASCAKRPQITREQLPQMENELRVWERFDGVAYSLDPQASLISRSMTGDAGWWPLPWEGVLAFDFNRAGARCAVVLVEGHTPGRRVGLSIRRGFPYTFPGSVIATDADENQNGIAVVLFEVPPEGPGVFVTSYSALVYTAAYKLRPAVCE